MANRVGMRHLAASQYAELFMSRYYVICAMAFIFGAHVLAKVPTTIEKPSESSLTYIKGHLLVKLGQKILPIELIELEKAAGAKRIHSYNLVEGLYLYQLEEHIDQEEARQRFLNSGAVIYAEPDYIYQTQVLDEDFKKQWALENTGQNGGFIDSDINALASWAIETGQKNVVVGITDTGIDYTHLDLAQNIWQNQEEIPGNNKDDDQNGYVDDVHGINAIENNGNPMDDNKHGTHVAGIIGAVPNKIGIRGVALQVEMAACKFLSARGSGSISDAVKCMEYFAHLKTRAKNPVNIIATNNSWGGSLFSESMLDAIKAHERLGILFIAAAGNSSDNNDLVERYPCGYRVPNVIAVAATDNKDQLAFFSSYGKKTVHVGAPGVKILSTVLNQGYSELNGTSMAAPHVTGLAVLIASHYPDYSYTRIKNLIMAGGQVTGGTKDTTISGRRIRGASADGSGSLGCVNQILKMRLSPLGPNIQSALGTSIFLSSTGINCDETLESVTLLDKDGVKIILRDNGLNGDEIANDGIYSLNWQPEAAGDYSLNFNENDILHVSVYDPRSGISIP